MFFLRTSLIWYPHTGFTGNDQAALAEQPVVGITAADTSTETESALAPVTSDTITCTDACGPVGLALAQAISFDDQYATPPVALNALSASDAFTCADTALPGSIVSDAVTLSDSLTLNAAISAADAGTLSDALGLAWSCADSFTLSELAQAPWAGDTITLSEATSFDGAAAADTVTLTDAILYADIVLFDTGTLTDVTSFDVSAFENIITMDALVWGVEGDDTITATDTGAFSMLASDAVTRSESFAEADAAITASDTATLTEPAPEADALQSASDAVTLSESAAVAIDYQAADAITLSDSATPNFGPVDAITLTESFAEADASVAGTDAATLDDSLSSLSAALNSADAATLNDSQSLLPIDCQLTDAFSAGDSATPGYGSTDTVSIDDSQYSITASISGTDTSTLDDSQSAVSAAQSASDSATLSDSLDLQCQQTLTDSVTLSDSLIPGLALSDAVTLDDTQSSVAAAVAGADTSTLDDSQSTLAAAVSSADTVTLTEPAAEADATLSLVDTSTFSETLSFAAELDDYASFTDTNEVDLSLTDTITESDSAFGPDAEDTVTCTDTVLAGPVAADYAFVDDTQVAPALSISDSATLSEFVSMGFVTDTVTLTDLGITEPGVPPEADYAFVDDSQWVINAAITGLDTVVLTEPGPEADASVSASDNATLTDSGIGGADCTLADALALTEGLVLAAAPEVMPPEEFFFSDSAEADADETLADTITLSDNAFWLPAGATLLSTTVRRSNLDVQATLLVN